MRPSLRRLAVAGCAFACWAATPAPGIAAHLLVIVTHGADGFGSYDYSYFRSHPLFKDISMSNTAEKVTYDPAATEHSYQLRIGDDPSYFAGTARLQCMDGSEMASSREIYSGKYSRVPDTGMNCLRWLHYSADAQRDPALRAQEPNLDLLAPYREILRRKGFEASSRDNADAVARRLVSGMNRTIAGNPEFQTTGDTIKFTLFNNQPEPFSVYPGAVFDAAFTEVVLGYLDSGTLPAPRPTPPALDDVTRACYSNQGVTNGQCQEAGKVQGQRYLKNTLVASRH